MPDVSYSIYFMHAESSSVILERLATSQKAANPKAAVRDWYRDHATDAQRENVVGETLVVIPTRNHHELAPSIETQPRLVF